MISPIQIPKVYRFTQKFALLLLFTFISLPAFASWWRSETVEASREVETGLRYERVVYVNGDNQPVRAHILSVSGVGERFIFGVLGSYGALVQPSILAKNSNAAAVINGGFFTVNPTRANGMVMAHGRLLYSPPQRRTYHGTVGFTPNRLLFDWIGPEDVSGNQFIAEREEWRQCHAALGAGPILVLNRHSRIQPEMEGFNTTQRAPRSAIGVMEDGLVLMMTVDGRQPGWSAGVTLGELADLFTSRGVEAALNLDGGGSSTMTLGAQVINRPSDRALPGQSGVERPVANVIALFRK